MSADKGEPRRIARHHWLGEVLSVRGPSSPSARLVACALFNHMQREGTGATVAGRTIAAETRLAYSTVKIALRQLIEQGWILRFEKGRGQYGKPLYVHEATLPNTVRCAGNGPTIDSMNSKCNGSTSDLIANPIVNGPIDENQWADSSKSMGRPPALNLLETIKKPVMDRLLVGPDPGSKDLNAEIEARIRKATELYPDASGVTIATSYVQGTSVDKVCRVRATGGDHLRPPPPDRVECNGFPHSVSAP
jgi:predicted transcriptional regulator